MNRTQAVKALRKEREGLPVLFQGLEAKFECRLLYLPPEVEFDTLTERPKAAYPGRLVALFRDALDPKPNGIVRKLTWKQVVGFIRRNFPR